MSKETYVYVERPVKDMYLKKNCVPKSECAHSESAIIVAAISIHVKKDLIIDQETCKRDL